MLHTVTIYKVPQVAKLCIQFQIPPKKPSSLFFKAIFVLVSKIYVMTNVKVSTEAQSSQAFILLFPDSFIFLFWENGSLKRNVHESMTTWANTCHFHWLTHQTSSTLIQLYLAFSYFQTVTVQTLLFSCGRFRTVNWSLFRASSDGRVDASPAARLVCPTRSHTGGLAVPKYWSLSFQWSCSKVKR